MFYSVLQYLERTAEKYSGNVAYEDLTESFSFLEVESLAKRIGSYICKKVDAQSPIVVYMDKHAYNIVAFLGAVYAGCFYVPIDSKMPLDRINLILNTLKPKAIMYDAATRKNVFDLETDAEKIDYYDAINSEIDERNLQRIREKVKSTDILYVLFTSGSTGVPKGVTISHFAAIDFMEWVCEKYGIDSDYSLCNQAPFYFDASMPDIYIPLISGATTYIPPKSYYTFPKKVLEYVERKKINTLIWVPSALCNVVNCKAFEVLVPSSVKLVIFCGEVMPCKHLNVWRKNLPEALFVNMYGPTEATYACMYYDIVKEFSDDDILPLGKACENSSIVLLKEDDTLAQVDEIGEICILGQCLSMGYFNALEKTTKAFVQNPLNTRWNEIMYRTGDLALIDKSGEMIFKGRKDSQIKRLGHRIELAEIESIILGIEGVDSACCIFNNSTNNILAIYVGKIEEKNINDILNNKLPSYMIPNIYKHLDSMPMNINGKIDRVRLKEVYKDE